MVRWRPSSGIGIVRDGAETGTFRRLGIGGMINQRVLDIRLFDSSGVEAGSTESSASSPAVGKGMPDALSRVPVLFGTGMGGAVADAAAEALSAALSSSLAENLGLGGMAGFLPKMGGPIPTYA